jgi:hypothetical protein
VEILLNVSKIENLTKSKEEKVKSENEISGKINGNNKSNKRVEPTKGRRRSDKKGKGMKMNPIIKNGIFFIYLNSANRSYSVPNKY